MTRPVVAVAGATADEPPPGIDRAERRSPVRRRRRCARCRAARGRRPVLVARPQALARVVVARRGGAPLDPVGERRCRRTAVPRARGERGRGHERARGLRGPDRGMGDRRDPRDQDRPAPVDRGHRRTALGGRPGPRPRRRVPSGRGGARTDRPCDRAARAGPGHVRDLGRARAAGRPRVRPDRGARPSARGARRSGPRARRAAARRGHAAALRRRGVRRDAARGGLPQRGPGRHGR